MHATSRGANTQSPAARAEATTKASETRAAARATNTKRVPCARPATSATEQAPRRAATPQRGACGTAVLFVRPEQAATSPRPKASSIWPARTASIHPPAQAAPTGSTEPNTNKYGSGAAIGQSCGALGSAAACWKGDSSSRDPTPSFFAALDCRFLTVDGLMPIWRATSAELFFARRPRTASRSRGERGVRSKASGDGPASAAAGRGRAARSALSRTELTAISAAPQASAANPAALRPANSAGASSARHRAAITPKAVPARHEALLPRLSSQAASMPAAHHARQQAASMGPGSSTPLRSRWGPGPAKPAML